MAMKIAAITAGGLNRWPKAEGNVKHGDLGRKASFSLRISSMGMNVANFVAQRCSKEETGRLNVPAVH